jgi:hypothetical protein
MYSIATMPSNPTFPPVKGSIQDLMQCLEFGVIINISSNKLAFEICHRPWCLPITSVKKAMLLRSLNHMQVDLVASKVK